MIAWNRSELNTGCPTCQPGAAGAAAGGVQERGDPVQRLAAHGVLELVPPDDDLGADHDRAVARARHLQVGAHVAPLVEVGEDVGEQLRGRRGPAHRGPWSGTTTTLTVPGARMMAA